MSALVLSLAAAVMHMAKVAKLLKGSWYVKKVSPSVGVSVCDVCECGLRLLRVCVWPAVVSRHVKDALQPRIGHRSKNQDVKAFQSRVLHFPTRDNMALLTLCCSCCLSHVSAVCLDLSPHFIVAHVKHWESFRLKASSLRVSKLRMRGRKQMGA